MIIVFGECKHDFSMQSLKVYNVNSDANAVMKGNTRKILTIFNPRGNKKVQNAL